MQDKIQNKIYKDLWSNCETSRNKNWNNIISCVLGVYGIKCKSAPSKYFSKSSFRTYDQNMHLKTYLHEHRNICLKSLTSNCGIVLKQ